MTLYRFYENFSRPGNWPSYFRGSPMSPVRNTEIFARLGKLEKDHAVTVAECSGKWKQVDELIAEFRDLKRFFIKLTLGALVSGSGLGAAVTGIIAAIQGG